jgi:hypothetical protein
MGGSTTSVFGWSFCLTNQQNRVDLIESIYGVKNVPQYKECVPSYVKWRWQNLLADHYLSVVEPLTTFVDKLIKEDDLAVVCYAYAYTYTYAYTYAYTNYAPLRRLRQLRYANYPTTPPTPTTPPPSDSGSPSPSLRE